jgi:signal transduction histidine kinase
LIDLASDRRKTLAVLQQVSIAGRGGVTASVFLEAVCAAVAEAFEFDYVAAMRYDAEAGEVREIASSGAAPAAGVSLFEEARETQSLVLLSVGDVDSGFALPLISGDRCLALLCGTRSAAAPPIETDWDVLATVGVVAATLLEDALVREEMETTDMLKSEFVALAAHELRNPLASIYGISVTLSEREDELAETLRQTLRSALREQATRVRNLIEQLLDLSRFDLAAIPISPEPIRLRPKIEELVGALADGRPNAVTIAVPPDLEAVVDPAALDRMLSNLIANSLLHGEPPVTVTAEGQDRHLRLAVEDRGRGVPREFVPRLFDRFARSTESSGRSDGSGLGLAIAQAYARAHGGEIVYEPAVPRGARFEVVIPLRGYGDKHPRIERSGGDGGVGRTVSIGVKPFSL